MGILDISNRKKKKPIIEEKNIEDETFEDLPVEITGEYNDDLNIMFIDSYVKKMFEGKIRQCNEKREELKHLEKEIEEFKGFQVDYYSLLEKKKNLEEECKEHLIRNNYEKYIFETKDILEKFKPLNVKYCIIKSMKTTESSEIEDIKKTFRLRMIEKYLSIAKKYMNINFIKTFKHSHNVQCESCDEPINYNEESICRCGLSLPVISKLTSFKELKTTSLFGQVYYEDLKNFIKALHAFQGEQYNKNNIIPKNLFDKLDSYFKGIGRQNGDYYRKLLHLSSGKKKGTSFQDLIVALDKIGHSDQYNNAHLIAKEYWGWKLLDLSEYEEKIIEDYKKVQKVWDEEKDRDSSPNVKIRLYLHLRARGIPVLREDFKFPVTSSCINYYNDRLKKIFESCGLYYENLI